jgi:hypothetical protein
VDLSGIIFVVLALAWAVYLIPKALKHHDEVARTRSVDRFSNAKRVLARREPVDRRNARLVVTPPRSTQRVMVPSRPAPQAQETLSPAASPRRAAVRRAAARAAARRRRRVTYVLLTADVAVAALAAFALLPWWSVAVPVALTVAFLVLCRRQVRRENDAVWAPQRSTDLAPRRAIRVDTAYGSPAAQPAHDEHSADEETVQIPVAELETVAVPVETVDGSSLWDPLPVTLPTYVNKARAPRTVRTIDLGAPDTWTSGRDEADTALVESATGDDPTEDTAEHEPWRAVGS